MAGVMGRDRGGLAEADGALSEPFSLPLELVVSDRETIRELERFAEGPERNDFALHALRIGVLALRQARGELDGAAIQRETQRMLEALDRQLGEHANLVQGRLAASLKEYFDPEGGRFSERVERLVKKDGDLERVLREQIAGDDSQLCKTLLAHVGQHSPLVKLLSPDESKGLFAALRATLAEQLQSQRERVLAEFSLDNKDGAMARLVKELAESHGQLSGKLQDKIDSVMEEFSLDKEDSALSRLVRNVDRAQRTISSEFSLDNEQSAFSRLRGMLESAKNAIDRNLTLDDKQSSLSRLKEEVVTILSAHCETNNRFQEEVKVALAKLQARREEAARGPQKGIAFEDAVWLFVQHEAGKCGDVAERTGERTGLIKNCKVGDLVVEMGPDSAAPGGRIVVEAKEDKKYSLAAACDEIDTARKNRGAQIGLFVFSSKTAPDGFKRFMRLGNDVFMVWDAEDSTSDVCFEAALSTTRALCARGHQVSANQAADFKDLDAAILEIEKRIGSMDDIDKLAEDIMGKGEKIRDEVRKSRKSLERQVKQLRDSIGELKHTLAPAGEP